MPELSESIKSMCSHNGMLFLATDANVYIIDKPGTKDRKLVKILTFEIPAVEPEVAAKVILDQIKNKKEEHENGNKSS